MPRQSNQQITWRWYFIVFILLLAGSVLAWRFVDLGVLRHSFLMEQSNARVLRVVSTPAYRGMIMDRFGNPLAVSTPVDSVWVNPQLFNATPDELKTLAKLLQLPPKEIQLRAKNDVTSREFIYLKRGLPPDIAEQVKALKVPGIFLQREYRRYYPAGEVAAHVIGFTNVDDVGQEGLELAYDKTLRGVPGKQRVIKDRLGHIISVVNVLNEPIQGRDLILSIDNRLQYIAYRNLKAAVQQFNADSGSVVILDPKTGEILAMANVPSYNPNQKGIQNDSRFRNRAVTDLYEPGSVIKSFSVANGLISGKYTPDTLVDTNPGVLVINGNQVHDDEPNNGVISVTQVLQKSSNIGVSKITLSLPPNNLPSLLEKVGFGHSTGSGFPGEENGVLPHPKRWRPFALATLSFGYGLSVTALQVAHAYAAIANHGLQMPLSFVKQSQPVIGNQVMPAKVADELLLTLEAVVQKGGTATLATVPGYRVAGKTGTAFIAGPHGYDHKRRNASFVGIVPVSDPRLVIIVVLNNPQSDKHMGGQVSAPVFSSITQEAMRLLAVPADVPIVTAQ